MKGNNPKSSGARHISGSRWNLTGAHAYANLLQAGGDDIVALDRAVLDVTGRTPLIEENLPTAMEVHTRVGHPLQWIHGPLKDPYKVTEYGEKLGLGTREYELVDVFPVEKIERREATYISAS